MLFEKKITFSHNPKITPFHHAGAAGEGSPRFGLPESQIAAVATIATNHSQEVKNHKS
jgi:hypothetical protein